MGVGPLRPEGILVGEGPGRDEVAEGHPFVGVTGRQLGESLTDAKLLRHKLFVMNATCCIPPAGTSAGDRKAAGKACSGAFQHQMKQLPPKAPAFAMGALAAWAVMGKDMAIKKARGFVRVTKEGRPVILSWHPTYAFFRNPYVWGVFELDLQRFARMVKGALRPGPEALLTEVTKGGVKRLSNEPFIAVDIETAPETKPEPWTGLDPTRANMKTIAIGTSKRGISTAKNAHLLKKILLDPKVVKVFHNGQWFDHRVMKRKGLDIVNWEDTRDARRVISSTSPLSLGYCATLYDDPPPWKEDEEDDTKGIVFTDDLEKLKRYNAEDCVRDARVWEGIQREPEWNTPRVQNLYAIQKQLSVVAAKMHTNGIRIDKNTRHFLAWGLGKEYMHKERVFLDAVGLGPKFRCTPNHMRALIYKSCETKDIARFGMPDPFDPKRFTPKGAIRVDHSSLLLLMIHPYTDPELKKLIKLYWAAEEVWKMRSTFVVSKKVSHAIGHDGRLRPGWNSCGTDTGRFSCSDPNVMNIEKLLRSMYVASPGNVIMEADFSQEELRIMRYVADDEVLAEALAAGDVYTEDAKALFGLPKHMKKCNCDGGCRKPEEHIKSKARHTSKIGHLAFQYGAGLKTFYAQMLDGDHSMTFDTASNVHNGLKQRYHRTVSYWQEELARVQECGYSESRIDGRRRVYAKEPELAEVANYPIQASARDIANRALIAVDRALDKVPGAKLIIDLHDAFYVDTPARHRGVVRRIFEDCMAGPEYTIGSHKFSLPIDIKEGTRWSELA